MTEIQPVTLVALVCHVLATLAGVCRLFGNVACAGKSPLGHNGTKDLINENGKEDNESYNVSDICAYDLIS